jgi:hypothetical protein
LQDESKSLELAHKWFENLQLPANLYISKKRTRHSQNEEQAHNENELPISKRRRTEELTADQSEDEPNVLTMTVQNLVSAQANMFQSLMQEQTKMVFTVLAEMRREQAQALHEMKNDQATFFAEIKETLNTCMNRFQFVLGNPDSFVSQTPSHGPSSLNSYLPRSSTHQAPDPVVELGRVTRTRAFDCTDIPISSSASSSVANNVNNKQT